MNREKLAKIAMLMTSPEKEEAHTALKIANKFLKENDMTWTDVISTKLPFPDRKRQTRTSQSKAHANRLLNNAEIIKETEKAFLVEARLKNNEEIEAWFPKSQMDERDGCVYISSWIETMKNEELSEQGYDSELSVF